MSKLSFYKQYKPNHGLENYILLVNNRRHIVQWHSSKICMNCALHDKSAKLGPDVEHIIHLF